MRWLSTNPASAAQRQKPYHALAYRNKILVIRFSSIGDIVLTTPVVRGLKQQLDAEVHFLTKRSFRSIVDANPYIDKVYAIDKRVGEVLPDLRREQYDVIIDLHRNLRSFLVKAGLPGRRSFSFDKLNWEKWLLVNWRINRLPDRHIVDRYLDTVMPLGVGNDGRGLDYFIPPGEEVDMPRFIRQNLGDSFLPPGEENRLGYLAFVIGAAHATKRLPPDRITSLCRQVGLPVILLGGPDDAGSGRVIAAAAGPHVINACGSLRLHQSASVVRQARLVITHDTGLMHIAAAFGKEIVSIWGNTIPAFGMYPYYPAGVEANHTVEVKGLSCRPCSKIGFDQCPRGHFRCMQDIPEGEVLKYCQGRG